MSSLEEKIADALIAAFDELGGDPQAALDAAMQQRSVQDWINQEAAVAGLAGGAEMIIPGLHALTIPAGIGFLIHKMAYICWGVGALKGAYVIETPHYSDLRNILTLWGNASYYNAHLLDYIPLNMDTVLYTFSEEGRALLESHLQRAEQKAFDQVTINTLYVMHELHTTFTKNERALRLVRTLAGTKRTNLAIKQAQTNAPLQIAFSPEDAELSRRIGTSLALRLAAQIGARVPARLLVGWIPLAGAAFNALFNAQTIMSMADTAQKYYDNAMHIETFKAL